MKQKEKQTNKDDYFIAKNCGYNYIDNKKFSDKSPRKVLSNKNISKYNQKAFMVGMIDRICEEADNYFSNEYSNNIHNQIQLENYYKENSVLIIEKAKCQFMESYNDILKHNTKLYNNLEEKFVVQLIHNFIPAYKSDIL